MEFAKLKRGFGEPSNDYNFWHFDEIKKIEKFVVEIIVEKF